MKKSIQTKYRVHNECFAYRPPHHFKSMTCHQIYFENLEKTEIYIEISYSHESYDGEITKTKSPNTIILR